MRKIPTRIETDASLDQMIDEYAADKAVFDDYKKLVDKENTAIKEYMLRANKPKYETPNGYRAVRSVSTKISMDEEKLLEIAHQYGISDIIKTKEYIDYTALEDALYNDRIPAEVVLAMNKAKTSKEVVTLRVTKVKEST